jgi:hypothetical protein
MLLCVTEGQRSDVFLYIFAAEIETLFSLTLSTLLQEFMRVVTRLFKTNLILPVF